MRRLSWLIAHLALVLTITAATLPPAIASAQDASTPMADSTEEIAEPTTPIPTTDTATETPPTSEPAAEPIPNSDSIAPIVDPLVIQPGQVYELIIEYQITTPRLESGIHLELRSTDSTVAENWVIEANGTGGFGAIDLIDGQTTPGTLAIRLRITAPSDARDGDQLTLFVNSIVRTIASEFETGVGVDTRAATIVVDAPEPTPTPEPTETVPATPESPVETPSPEPTTPPATPEPETPASPQPEMPTAEPSPAATIDLASELTLVGRKSSTTVAIGESRAVTLEYDYLVGFARSGTTISAQMVNWDGSPLEGWSVTLNEAAEPFHDGEHLDPGSTFDLTVTVSVDDTVKANAKARLMFTVTVDPQVATEDSASFTFAAASLETGDEQTVSEDVEGPMFRLDGGFETSAVTSPNNGLTCHNATNFPGGVDTLVPGQLAQFRCDLAVTGLLGIITILPTFSGTATIQGTNLAGWEIMATSQVALLTATVLEPSGSWNTSSVDFGGLNLLGVSLGTLLDAGGFSFGVWVKAPFVPTSLLPVSSVSILVNTTCSATVLLNCRNTLGSKTSNVTLTASVADIQTTANGGGGVTNLGLLGAFGSQISDGLLFRLTCDQPSTGTQVQPNEEVDIPCHIVNLVDLSLLGGVASLNAAITVSFSDSPSPWSMSVDEFTLVNGVFNLELDEVLDTNVINAQYDFTITLAYDAPSCVTVPFANQPLNALQVTADYQLALLTLPLTGAEGLLPLSQGWASVPIQLEGASSSPVGYVPVLSASGVSFGTYQFSGATASYSKVSAGQPALTVSLSPNGGANCSARAFYVTAQFSVIAGYTDAGHTNPLGTSISAGQIAFSGSPTGSYTNTTTFVPAVSGSPVTVIASTNTMLAEMTFSYGMALAPPSSQPVGYYLGTVTLTMVSGTPP